ncbi:hypothetical protein L798_04860 [Zootermopsis nevadensis]|uniref:Uncharacterized protein n=1 Tax=Zootermopsis nevadensis TaxID=136037 RepID=A0A067RA96_ZOONE|nr:hypothetical protein L798_04860 [Zootermopsis nevadensis]
MILLPRTVFICLAKPKTEAGAFLNLPINKMLNSFATYIIFLTLVFMVSNQDKTNQIRGPTKPGFEVAVLVYVVSYIWSSFTLFLQGPQRFFTSLTNW